MFLKTETCSLKELFVSCKSKQNMEIKNAFMDFIQRV